MTLDDKDSVQTRDLLHPADERNTKALGWGVEMEPDSHFDWDLEDEYQHLTLGGLFVSIPRIPPDRN